MTLFQERKCASKQSDQPRDWELDPEITKKCLAILMQHLQPNRIQTKEHVKQFKNKQIKSVSSHPSTVQQAERVPEKSPLL